MALSAWQLDVLDWRYIKPIPKKNWILSLGWSVVFAMASIAVFMGFIPSIRITQLSFTINGLEWVSISWLAGGILGLMAVISLKDVFNKSRNEKYDHNLVCLSDEQRVLLGLPHISESDEIRLRYNHHGININTPMPRNRDHRRSHDLRRSMIGSPPATAASAHTPRSTRSTRSIRNHYDYNLNSPFSPTSPSNMSYNDFTSSFSSQFQQSTTPKRMSLPSSRTDHEICDTGSLEEFMEQRREWEDQENALLPGQMPMPSLLFSNSPRSRYRPAKITSLGAVSEDGVMNFTNPSPSDLLHSLDTKLDEFEDFSDHLRRWLSRHVLEPLVLLMGTVNEEMGRQIPVLQFGGIQPIVALLDHSSVMTSPMVDGPNGQLKLQAIARFNQAPIAIKLQQFLDVRGASSREYLISRIFELSRGGSLSGYKWNSGGQWKGKAWSSDHPTDAQLLMHLFCTFMDQILPSDQAGRPFTDRYFLRDEHPSAMRSSIKIQQISLHPPHFRVLVHHKTKTRRQSGRDRDLHGYGYGGGGHVIDEIWETPSSGRGNVFQAICLFLLYTKKRRGGLLDQVNLGSSTLNLLSVLE